jgi:hypothetical protein
MSVNALWSLRFTVAQAYAPKAFKLRGASCAGAGNFSLILSSADLASPKAARKRAADTLRVRLKRLGVPAIAVTVTRCECVG